VGQGTAEGPVSAEGQSGGRGPAVGQSRGGVGHPHRRLLHVHGHAHVPGKVVQVDPMNPKLKPPRTQRLKLKCDIMLTDSAFKFNVILC
jgi:hypothetical protein